MSDEESVASSMGFDRRGVNRTGRLVWSGREGGRGVGMLGLVLVIEKVR